VVLLILGLYHLLHTEDLRGRDERKRPDECWRSASTYGEQKGAESSDLEGNSYCSRIVPGFLRNSTIAIRGAVVELGHSLLVLLSSHKLEEADE
jgi:hypothetical protein